MVEMMMGEEYNLSTKEKDQVIKHNALDSTVCNAIAYFNSSVRSNIHELKV